MERISMSRRERRRAEVCKRIKDGRISIAQAAGTLQISTRQAKRIWARFRVEGDAGIVHRAHGKPSNRRTDPAFRERVLALCAEH